MMGTMSTTWNITALVEAGIVEDAAMDEAAAVVAAAEAIRVLVEAEIIEETASEAALDALIKN
jgi:hypothetical protein